MQTTLPTPSGGQVSIETSNPAEFQKFLQFLMVYLQRQISKIGLFQTKLASDIWCGFFVILSAMNKVAIIGYGQFGRFMAKHLRPYVKVVPVDVDTDPAKIADCDMVVYAVPFDALEQAIHSTKPHVKAGALILDISSVKQKPLALLKKYFKKHEILGTHPMFGPESGAKGIEGLPIVLCNISFTHSTYRQTKQFLKKELGLKVVEQTPKQHDQEVAYMQGLSHFIGKALLDMGLKSYAANTQSYAYLLRFCGNLKNDSWDLFKTIQNANPEAKKVRAQFRKTLEQLEKQLQEG